MLSKFFNKYFLFVLFIIVLISYGQTLFMLPWQDDNALYFKLAHIEEAAGFLGKGIFGEGPYKYTAFFYYPIYLLFGYNPFFYFLLGFILFFVSVLVIKKVSAEILGERSGKIASFLYACGYIASDGYIRLYNSVITSLSIIFSSLLFYFYWKFVKKGKVIFYFLTVAFYLLATEFALARTHYLIVPVIAFEVIFLLNLRKIKSFFLSLVRIAPFSLIFYKYFIFRTDERSLKVVDFVGSLVRGDFSVLYGFLSSLTNLVIPDWLTNFITIFNDKLFIFTRFNFRVYDFVAIAIIVFMILVFAKRKRGLYLTASLTLVAIWFYFSKKIFITPALNLDYYHLKITFLGGVIFLTFLLVYTLIDKINRKLYLFLCIWLVAALIGYSAYGPRVSYESINRYLAHSFLALVLIFGLFSKRRAFLYIALLWGVGNLWTSFSYQRVIVAERTQPVIRFYRQLKEILPKINKGDVLFFDVADNVKGNFADAFSVAQMPDETAIAWRYGIDRYDFNMFSEFSDFSDFLEENNVDVNSVHTFYFTRDKGLIETTGKFYTLLKKVGGFKVERDMIWPQKEMIIDIPVEISCVQWPKLLLTINSQAMDSSQFSFPLLDGPGGGASVDEAYNYQMQKQYFRLRMKAFSSGDWRQYFADNILDGDSGSYWRANRVFWMEEVQYVGIDLGETESVDALFWQNGFSNSTPTKYRVEVSNDFINWVVVSEVENVNRLEENDLQKVSFDETGARYIRMVIEKSLDGDAPSVAEMWVIPGNTDSIDVDAIENFLKNPFSNVPNASEYNRRLRLSSAKGRVNVYWKTDRSDGWHNEFSTNFDVLHDGVWRNYSILIPCGGSNLSQIRINNLQIPSRFRVGEIKYSYPGF